MKLAVIFPGIGYHADKPLLYYGAKAAEECGFRQRICVTYHTAEKNIRGDSEKMRKVFTEMYDQAESQLQGTDFAPYEDIVFISKSIGTVVAAAYARQHGIHCRHIFYTPLEETFAFSPEKGIAFTGTADPWVHTDILRGACKKAAIPLQVVQDGNHSLETGHVLTDTASLQSVMEKTIEYLKY